ncbi:MAG TPA: thioredoxin fold domain-containing protein [candidate division Zixibacteria bacterium]|nr:thioredoxin fold domain-containing protein [candidate division Zixibacteria bacterium]MDD4917330.1 thioredoxin fold domain-containing protein [candidate division Zixibacteria bacterium]MDM7971522.1 thioredoxin fold domain-containing protein [candidate division Zixibacteria bacterium]HOD67313.1 thioredoxin fold domain-containing protein [candidate division Zixibacteria bacterium]HOZ07207.1 thioredoxin fold domain-containing protein [candidate division Zixibacteria bacterium]
MKAITPIMLPLVLVLAAGAFVFADDESGKTAAPAEIQWVAYDVGLQRAAAEKKHVLVDFTAKWCGFCKKMDRETFAKPEVVEMINANFIPVKVDGDSQKELNVNGYKITEANLAKKEFGVRGYPTFWFLKSDGSKLGQITGYRPPDVMMEALSYVKDEQYDTTKTETPKSND